LGFVGLGVGVALGGPVGVIAAPIIGILVGLFGGS